MALQKGPFGKAPDGELVDLYTLSNANGLRARIMTYGAIVLSLETPDRDGKLADITLGYDTLDEYIKDNPYFGAIVGRYGNRIGRGKFTLDGVEYSLATNNGDNHLHGGVKGFDKVVWKGEELSDSGAPGVKLSYLSRDGEEGYPGNFASSVTYRLTDENELKIIYDGETDKATPVNLTFHGYFNLAGHGESDILGHELTLHAARFTPVAPGLIPTGELQLVAGTPLDFTSPTPIGARIAQHHEQLELGGGYDHNWVLDSQDGTLALAAEVHEPTSGRVMQVYTTEPGIQFYAGNFLDGTNVGKGGKPYNHRTGFCLETQHYPDSPNNPQFPSTILRPGERYAQETVYKFQASAI